MSRNKTVIATCKHFGRRFVWRIETDYASTILGLPKGVYEMLAWPPACTGRKRQPKYQYISTLKRFCPVVGGQGCRSYAPLDSPAEFVFDGKALFYRYIGPLGDPDAEEEAARIGNISVL